MDRDYIRTYLKARNYWWSTGRVDPAEAGTAREDYIREIEDFFSLERIIALTGLRRSGKTTIQFQIIERLLARLDPANIAYFKMDDLLDRADSIHDVVSVYKELSGRDPLTDEVYFFIDEIHSSKGWQTDLKYYMDAHARCKFIVSGSSRTMLQRDSSESLAGRIAFVNIFPLTFKEFAIFSGLEIKGEADIMDYESVRRFHTDNIVSKERIVNACNEYMEVGGFPEWFKVKNRNLWYKTLEDYIALILFRDIVSVFAIKDAVLLEKLVREVAQLSTNRFSYLNLSNRLDADRVSVKNYLHYLQSAMLLYISEVYSGSRSMSERREKKIYLWEEGLRKALSLDADSAKAVENVVAWHLIKKGSASQVFYRPYYWRNVREVDYVYYDGKTLLPVEVKYGSKVSGGSLKGLAEFAQKYKIKKAVVVTKDLLDEREINGSKILFIPAWLFLLTAA